VTEVERLFWRAERYNRLLLSSPARYRRSVRNYERFLKACSERSGDAAEEVIHDSIRWAVELLSPGLRSESDVEGRER
jgi:DNA-binding GntR family transcriptional regulator